MDRSLHTGHFISGAGHIGLILWLLLGGLFARTPEPFEMTEVSVISGADFDALVAAAQPPAQVEEVAQPAAPQAPADEPAVEAPQDTAIAQPTPVQTETPLDDPVPEVAETPPTDLSENAGDVAVLVPEVAPEAAPRPVERVAPEPVARPDPEAAPDIEEREAAAPDAEGETTETEQREATAPEEAVAEIVTEATTAPAASVRPPGRRPAAPARQAAVADPEPQAETPQAAPTDNNAVNNDDVLAALQAAQQAVAAPSGPPLSAGEKDALRVAVSKCWNVGSLSSEALGTTVVIGVQMNQNGTPVVDTIRRISHSGGSDAAAQRVYDSARRAIILCGSRGYDLPAEKFSQWQNIEMTFDPRKMGLR